MSPRARHIVPKRGKSWRRRNIDSDKNVTEINIGRETFLAAFTTGAGGHWLGSAGKILFNNSFPCSTMVSCESWSHLRKMIIRWRGSVLTIDLPRLVADEKDINSHQAVEVYLYFGDRFDFYIQQNVLYSKILEIVNLTENCIFQAAWLHHDNSNMSKWRFEDSSSQNSPSQAKS